MERVIRVYSQMAKLAGDEVKAGLEKALESWKTLEVPPLFFSPLEEKTLGLYSASSNCIFLSEALLSYPKETILQTALHELAHYINYCTTGSTAHDGNFKEICKTLGIDSAYANAKVDIKSRASLLEKVKKLQALSSSPFEAESQSALRKVRELMANYSLSEKEEDGSQIYCMELCMSRSRIDTKYRILAQLVSLQTGIWVVRVNGKEGKALCAYGQKEELEVASYLYDVLYRAIEKELASRRRKDPVKYSGVTGTNSFYRGVYAAIKSRLDTERQSGDSSSLALTVMASDNERLARELVFYNKTLVKRPTYFRNNRAAYEGGQSFGSTLQIKKGVRKDAEHLQLNKD